MAGSEFFSRNAEAYSKSTSHARGRDLTLLLEKIGAERKDVAIDIATGTGFTAVALSEIVGAVTAIDPTENMIREAQNLADSQGNGNIEFAIGIAEHLPVADSSFNVATCRRAAHHFSDKMAFLREASRALVPGGKMGLVDMVSPQGHADEFNRLERERDRTHLAAEEAEVWQTLFSQAGFDVKSCEIEEERLTFDKWIYPVDPHGETAEKCRGLLRGADAGFAAAIVLGSDLSFIKRRMVLVGCKK